MTELHTGLKSLAARIREPLRAGWREYRLHRALHQLVSLPQGVTPTPEDLVSLRRLWGNEGFSADVAYLGEVAAQAVSTPGPVLECGSGLTTLLLGCLAGRRGIDVWSLEHSPEWHARVGAVLQRHAVPRVRLCLALIEDYGAFSWYRAPFAEMPNDFRLVVCDGPPDATPGGRYGLMPVLKQKFASDVLILMDDANRRNEAEALRRWQAEANLTVTIHRRTTPGRFARISWASQQPPSTS